LVAIAEVMRGLSDMLRRPACTMAKAERVFTTFQTGFARGIQDGEASSRNAGVDRLSDLETLEVDDDRDDDADDEGDDQAPVAAYGIDIRLEGLCLEGIRNPDCPPCR